MADEGFNTASTNGLVFVKIHFPTAEGYMATAYNPNGVTAEDTDAAAERANRERLTRWLTEADFE